MPKNIWYTRPVFFVASLTVALEFYVNRLGFHKSWHEADGEGTVCQVDKDECEIILCEDSGRSGGGRIFLELTKEGVDQLMDRIAAHRIPSETKHWGYKVLGITDPDGNELYVCLDNLL